MAHSIYFKGKKYPLGGYGGGGTEVEANPSGTPTETLQTIQIGDVIYSVPSGGGGSNIQRGYITENLVSNTTLEEVSE